MSRCVESDIRYMDLAITYIEKQVDYLKKTTKLWPLIVYKLKQAKPDTSNIFQIRFKIGGFKVGEVYQQTCIIFKSTKLWPLIVYKSKQIRFKLGVYVSRGYQIIISVTKYS